MHKTTIIIIIMLCAGAALHAQDALRFKGLPMTGPCTAFAAELEAKGFVNKGTLKDGSIRMTGSFAGKKDVQTVIGPVSETNGDVMTVTLSIPAATASWDDLTAAFAHYRKHYTLKYGEPSELSEKGTGEDYRSMADLKKGVCHYRALWVTGSGTITMTLRFVSSSPCVVIRYADRAAEHTAEKEIVDDI